MSLNCKNCVSTGQICLNDVLLRSALAWITLDMQAVVNLFAIKHACINLKETCISNKSMSKEFLNAMTNSSTLSKKIRIHDKDSKRELYRHHQYVYPGVSVSLGINQSREWVFKSLQTTWKVLLSTPSWNPSLHHRGRFLQVHSQMNFYVNDTCVPKIIGRWLTLSPE